jgi:hypothetical protein
VGCARGQPALVLFYSKQQTGLKIARLHLRGPIFAAPSSRPHLHADYIASMLLAQRLHGPAVRVTRPAAVVVVCSGPAKPRPTPPLLRATTTTPEPRHHRWLRAFVSRLCSLPSASTARLSERCDRGPRSWMFGRPPTHSANEGRGPKTPQDHQ